MGRDKSHECMERHVVFFFCDEGNEVSARGHIAPTWLVSPQTLFIQVGLNMKSQYDVYLICRTRSLKICLFVF